MNKLIALLPLLALTSCIDHIQRVEITPTFKAGQCVEFTDNSFYSECSASVLDYNRYAYTIGGKKSEARYKVKFMCTNGSIFVLAQGEAEVPESELKPCSK